MNVPAAAKAHFRFLALTDCASQHCGERWGITKRRHGISQKAQKKKPKEGPKGPFSIGFALLTNITEISVISGAQVRSGETRQDLKIPTVSGRSLPRALSCSNLASYRCLSAVMAAFPTTTPDTQFLFRLFAPSWAICTNSPFSPTTTSVQVTVYLNPILTDTTNRQW